MSAKAKAKKRAKGQSRASETPAERPSARSTAVTRKRASKAKRNRAAEPRAARSASTASSDVERSAIAVTLPPSAERSTLSADGRQFCWWFAASTSTSTSAAADAGATPAQCRRRPSHAQFRELDSLVRLDRAQSGAGREVALIDRATLRALRANGWVFVSIIGFVYLTQAGESAYLRERSRRYWRALDRSQTDLSELWGAT